MTNAVQLVEALRRADALGSTARPRMAPDEVLLLSGGPPSHLARQSLIVQPPRRRAVFLQPELFPSGPSPSILEEPHLHPTGRPMLLEVQEWKDGAWTTMATTEESDLGLALERLEEGMLDRTAFASPLPGWPSRPFLAGSFAYDLVQWTQPLSLHHPPPAGSVLGVVWEVRGALVVDHRRGSHHRLSQPGNAWAETVDVERLEKIESPSLSADAVASSLSDEEHERAIEEVRQAIVRGRMYQVNVGRRWSGPLKDRPWSVLRRLQADNPAPFSAWIHAPDLDHMLLSSSPESLLRVEHGRALASPIKGSYPRGVDRLEEEALRRALIEDDKETAEHRMLVDLMRNDLGAIAVPGSVDVQRYDVEAYATVQHLVSQVGADLEVGLPHAFASVFPGGSITGCPRTVVCAAIDAVEKEARRFWCGSVGWWDPDGHHASWNILIRTMQVRSDGEAWAADVHAGGGITIASQARREIEEARWKADALLTAAGWQERTPSTSGELRITPLSPPPGPPTGARVGRWSPQLAGAVLLIDNMDSFTHNIAHAIMRLGHDVHVVQARRHDGNADAMTQAWLDEGPTHIVLGPGPGRPEEARVTMCLAEQALRGPLPPLLGICLGHQALGLAAGGRIIEDPHGPVHGRPVRVVHDGTGLFEGLASRELGLVRYNSLIVAGLEGGPLRINARAGHVTMGLTDPAGRVHGLQGHPESIGSPEGEALLRAFLDTAHA